jgi:hypothetical protein
MQTSGAGWLKLKSAGEALDLSAILTTIEQARGSLALYLGAPQMTSTSE